METGQLALILVMLLFSAFFSAGEMAFLASNKLTLEMNRLRYPRMSRIIDKFTANSGVLIATILVGNNIALVIYGLEFGNVCSPIIAEHISDNQSVILLLQTIASTVIIIVTAEFLPKTIIRFNPSLMLNILALPLMFFYILFYPIGSTMQAFAHFLISKLFGKRDDTPAEPLLPSRLDLDTLLSKQTEISQTSENATDAHEAKLMKNALSFAKAKVRDCIVPRTDIVAVDVNDTVEELRDKFIETGYSRILVYNDTIDNIIGFVHVSEIFRGARTIRNMMSTIVVVPETMSAHLLLKQFTGQHKSIALVVDEFGGTAGMVTMEDVLEEIFGEIDDEHDEVEYEENEVAPGEYIFSGRLEIDYLNDKYNLKLPTSEDYDTLAGLILSVNQSIPNADDTIEIDDFEFKILVASHSRIDKVKVIVK